MDIKSSLQALLMAMPILPVETEKRIEALMKALDFSTMERIDILNHRKSQKSPARKKTFLNLF